MVVGTAILDIYPIAVIVAMARRLGAIATLFTALTHGCVQSLLA